MGVLLVRIALCGRARQTIGWIASDLPCSLRVRMRPAGFFFPD
jgi:hypothetical protein